MKKGGGICTLLVSFCSQYVIFCEGICNRQTLSNVGIMCFLLELKEYCLNKVLWTCPHSWTFSSCFLQCTYLQTLLYKLMNHLASIYHAKISLDMVNGANPGSLFGEINSCYTCSTFYILSSLWYQSWKDPLHSYGLHRIITEAENFMLPHCSCSFWRTSGCIIPSKYTALREVSDFLSWNPKFSKKKCCVFWGHKTRWIKMEVIVEVEVFLW